MMYRQRTKTLSNEGFYYFLGERDILEFMKKKWSVAKKYPEDYAEKLQGDDLTLQILFNRNINTQKKADEFFAPDYDRDTHDPFLLPDMEKAVARFLDAMKKNEKILIFSDYDVDGVCGTIVFSDFFRFVGYSNISFYNPDRYKEGYGLTAPAKDAVLKENPSLVVTVDTGISDVEGVKILQQKGIDVIVTDHHLVPDPMPPAFAIVDHKRKDNTYPFPWLCGTGMAFKFVQALFQKGGWPLKEGYEKWILDVVAIATVADMVPLKDENRMWVYWGLEVLKKNRRPGLKALLESQQYVSAPLLTSQDLAFTLGPLINAAGRIDHANMAVELLRAETPEEARWLSGRLNETNKERKRMTEEIIAAARNELKKELPAVIVLGDDAWYPGVLGHAANRLVEEFARPAFLFGKADGETAKGSSRSDGSVNLVEFMSQAGEGLFEVFGGHAMAAGFTLKEGTGKELKKRLNDVYKKIEKEKNLFEELQIDKTLSLDEVEWDTYATLSRFEPFGMDNPRPVFLFKDLIIDGVRVFGNGADHLELQFKKTNGNRVKAISFGDGKEAEKLSSGFLIDLAASVERNSFRDTDELRLRIVDYKLKSSI
ncbi:MAG: single-stranded-DNA-specific exonuclease RecJ [Candidatus Niyogibacteria bacterium]|nr:single-stranded-DNA-specific exonuclease RecJ [Candidatus Niyogibacteria bacterium]